MDIQESGEMYLESLLILSKEKNTVRAIDIAEFMNFSKASVSRALSKLKEGRFILVDGDGYIAFTERDVPSRKAFTSATPFLPTTSSASVWTRRPRRPTPARLSMSSARRPFPQSRSTRRNLRRRSRLLLRGSVLNGRFVFQ